MFILHRQEEIGKILSFTPKRAVVLVPTPEEADALWAEEILATTAMEGKWDDDVAEKLEMANVVVLGNCGGIQTKLDKAASRLHVPIADVKGWFASLVSPKKKALADLCDAARKGDLKNLADTQPKDAPETQAPKEERSVTLSEAQVKAFATKLRANAVVMGELVRWSMDAADKLEKLLDAK